MIRPTAAPRPRPADPIPGISSIASTYLYALGGRIRPRALGGSGRLLHAHPPPDALRPGRVQRANHDERDQGDGEQDPPHGDTSISSLNYRRATKLERLAGCCTTRSKPKLASLYRANGGVRGRPLRFLEGAPLTLRLGARETNSTFAGETREADAKSGNIRLATSLRGVPRGYGTAAPVRESQLIALPSSIAGVPFLRSTLTLAVVFPLGPALPEQLPPLPSETV
jgi:hypothetical protein